MAAMTTALTEFSTIGDSITYTFGNHSVTNPKIVVQKRRVPSGAQTMAESSLNVVRSTSDADGVVLPQKVSFQVIVRYPILGQAADVTSQRDIFRDIVASDEFANMVDTQEPLK